MSVPDIVLFFDGSYSGDSTGLVGVTIEAIPHIFVVAAWERPIDDDHWRVDIADVEATILRACAELPVKMVGADPYRWQRSIQALQGQGIPIGEYPTNSLARMVPATAKFYDAVMEQKVTHDGDLRLARHIDNCVLKVDSRGPRVVKEHKMSNRKIDLAICAIGGFDLATGPQEEEVPASEPFGFWA